MINSDVGLLFSVGAFCVATFVSFQVVGWRSNHVIMGGTRKFARIVMSAGVLVTSAMLLCLLVLTFNVRSFGGAPFVFLYTLALLSPFIIPALTAIELILIGECVLMTRVERGVLLWHLGALLACTGWSATLLLAFVLGR